MPQNDLTSTGLIVIFQQKWHSEMLFDMPFSASSASAVAGSHECHHPNRKTLRPPFAPWAVKGLLTGKTVAIPLKGGATENLYKYVNLKCCLGYKLSQEQCKRSHRSAKDCFGLAIPRWFNYWIPCTTCFMGQTTLCKEYLHCSYMEWVARLNQLKEWTIWSSKMLFAERGKQPFVAIKMVLPSVCKPGFFLSCAGPGSG